MGDPARGEGVLERADQRFLTDQRRKPRGAVGAGEDPVGGGALQLRLHRPGRAGKAEGWTTTRRETRYGCFLPDLTGLARAPSTASLPRANIGRRLRRAQGCRPTGRAL